MQQKFHSPDEKLHQAIKTSDLEDLVQITRNYRCDSSSFLSAGSLTVANQIINAHLKQKKATSVLLGGEKHSGKYILVEYVAHLFDLPIVSIDVKVWRKGNLSAAAHTIATLFASCASRIWTHLLRNMRETRWQKRYRDSSPPLRGD